MKKIALMFLLVLSLYADDRVDLIAQKAVQDAETRIFNLCRDFIRLSYQILDIQKAYMEDEQKIGEMCVFIGLEMFQQGTHTIDCYEHNNKEACKYLKDVMKRTKEQEQKQLQGK